MDNMNYQKISHHLNAGENELVIQHCHKTKNLKERGDICYLLGLAYMRTGKPNLAITQFEHVININPDIPQIYFELGVALIQIGELKKSCNIFKTCLELEPNFPAAIEKLGFILTSLGQHKEAIEILQRFLSKDPNQPSLYNCLSYAYERLGDLAKAEASIRMAIKYSPNSPELHNNLGNILKAKGNSKEAIQSFRKALKINPDFSGMHSNLLLCMNYVPSVRPEEIFQEHKKWASQFKQLEHFPKSSVIKSSDKKIRIAYASPDFRNHPVAHFFLPIIRSHNRSKFEIYCYAEVANPDIFSQEIAKLADSWVNTCGMTDYALAKKICDDNIDILVDLAGHTDNNRLGLFALKPAPVQVTYLGYPNTTGLNAIDYRISDDILDPKGNQQFYTEKLIRLPQGFSCFSPPKFYPDVANSPYLKNGTITFGSFNNPAKFNTETFNVWSLILKAVPNSRLLFYRNVFRQQEKENIIKQFIKNGIHQDRIIVLNKAPNNDNKLPPGRRYLGVMSGEVDICLDTFPWSGHTTSCESLWMGVPVVTLYGDRPSSRLCASVLNQLELSFLVATNKDDYVKIATKLATQPELLSNLRSNLRQQMSSSILCNGKLFTPSLELAFEKMLTL